MSSFPDLLTSFAEAVEALKVKLSQNPSSSTMYNGELIQSIAKDVEDMWAPIQAMVQGRLAYETKVEMDAAGAPPEGTILAEVWRDLDELSNGLYGWTGSVWEKSPYDIISIVNSLLVLTQDIKKDVLGSSLRGNANNLYTTPDHFNYTQFISDSGISREKVDGVWCLKASANNLFSKDLDLDDFPSGYISACFHLYKYGNEKSSGAINRVVIFQHDDSETELARASVNFENDVEKQWAKIEGFEILPACTRLRFYIETYRSEYYISSIGIFDGMDAGYRDPVVNGNMWPDRDYSGFGIEPDSLSFPEQNVDVDGNFQYKLPVDSIDRDYMWRYFAVSPFSPGSKINFKGEFKNASIVGGLIAEIRYYDVNGGIISTVSDGNNTLDWESFRISSSIPDNAHYVRFGWQQRGISNDNSYIKDVSLYSSEPVNLPIINSNQIIDQIQKQVGVEVQNRPRWSEIRADDNRSFGNLIRDPINFVDFSASLTKGYIEDVYCGLLGTATTRVATLRIPQSHFRNEQASFGLKIAANTEEVRGRILIRMMLNDSTESIDHRITYDFTADDMVESGSPRDKWKSVVIPNFRVPTSEVDLTSVEIYLDSGATTNPDRLFAFCDPWIVSGNVYNPINTMASFDDYWVDPTMLGNMSDGRGDNVVATNPNDVNQFRLEADSGFVGRYYRFSAGGAWQEGARIHFHAELHNSQDSFADNAVELAFIYRDEFGVEISPRQSLRTDKRGIWQSKDIFLNIPTGTKNFEIRAGARGDEGVTGKVIAHFRNFIASNAPQTSPWRKKPYGGGSVNPGSGVKQVYVGPGGDDTNDGSRSAPYATGARAAQDLLSGGVIKMLEGTYTDFSIPLVNINGTLIVTAESMSRPRIIFTSGLIDSTWSKLSGTDNVWFVGGISSFSRKYIWEHETPQHQVVEDERHPLQRGRSFRLPSFRLYKVDSLTDCDANAGTYFYDEAAELLYIHNSDSTDPNNQTYYIPTTETLFSGNHSGVHATVKKTDLWYGGYDVENLASFELHDVRSMGAALNGCDRGRTSGIEKRVEYCGAGNDGGNAHNSKPDWNGPAGDVPPASTVTSVDMYCHDNYDDGDSLHERCEGSYIGGLWEYNGDRGVATSYGAHVTLTNGLARHNGQYTNELGQNRPGNSSGGEGFACVGSTDPKEGGVGTQMSCFSSVSYGNNLNFALNRGGNNDRMDCVNCVSEDAKLAGYSAENAGNIMTLRNCTDKGSPVAKREVLGGQIVVKNGDLVI